MRNDKQLIRQWLVKQKSEQLYRSHRISDSAQQAEMVIDGKPVINFCSNDYLGLANHPDILKAFKTAANHYGVGSGSAHLITGHSRAHYDLEQALAEFTGRERALLFSNGYMANFGVINALTERGDMIYADRLNHASLVDGCLLSRAKLKRYAHNDCTALGKLITQQSNGDSLIVSDGVFSMDGDVASVKELTAISQANNAWLMIDDAHGFGVLGERGAGLIQQEKLSQDEVPVLMATLGKAAGTAGAFIAGSEELIEYLIQTSRSYIYTTAMPAAIAAATLSSLNIIENENWRRKKLKTLTTKFKQGAKQLGLQLMPSDTAIQPIVIGESSRAVNINQTLFEAGILVSAIRPPTVPVGTSRLRITLSAAHDEVMVEQLLDVLEKAVPV